MMTFSGTVSGLWSAKLLQYCAHSGSKGAILCAHACTYMKETLARKLIWAAVQSLCLAINQCHCQPMTEWWQLLLFGKYICLQSTAIVMHCISTDIITKPINIKSSLFGYPKYTGRDLESKYVCFSRKKPAISFQLDFCCAINSEKFCSLLYVSYEHYNINHSIICMYDNYGW